MIANLNVIFPSIVEALSTSPYEFYLTGSRFFGGYNRDSDWDFFVKDSPEVLEYLNALGFEKDLKSPYDDPSITAVYCIYCRHQGNSVKIDVQLVNSVECKLKAQQVLKICWPAGMYHFDKDCRKAIWKTALAAVNLTADE